MSCIYEMSLPVCKGCTTRRDCWCCDKIGDWIRDRMDVEQHGDLIRRSALLEFAHNHVNCTVDCNDIARFPSVDAEPVITGETSDGYHTFNELYHHRAVLFSVIVKAFPERAWKARQHHDGTMYEGMFIVGIDTPDGQASYHYDIDPYWDMFDCRELERAPEWDGHTPAQAIERIGRLEPVRRGRWIFKVYDERINYRWNVKAYCSECCDEEQEIWAGFFPGVPDFMAHDIALDNAKTVKLPNYCQTCGAKMDAEVIDHGSNPTEHGH